MPMMTRLMMLIEEQKNLKTEQLRGAGRERAKNGTKQEHRIPEHDCDDNDNHDDYDDN